MRRQQRLGRRTRARNPKRNKTNPYNRRASLHLISSYILVIVMEFGLVEVHGRNISIMYDQSTVRCSASLQVLCSFSVSHLTERLLPENHQFLYCGDINCEAISPVRQVVSACFASVVTCHLRPWAQQPCASPKIENYEQTLETDQS
jgi:hypothetical protein